MCGSLPRGLFRGFVKLAAWSPVARHEAARKALKVFILMNRNKVLLGRPDLDGIASTAAMIYVI